MRLLAVNPNTSEDVTRAFVAEARRVAPPGVEIEGVTGRFGARIVTTEAENLIAAHSALTLVAENALGFDGILLAISFDTALSAASQLLPMPAVGITEAALYCASEAGRPFGVVIFGASSRPLYEALFDSYGRVPMAIEIVEFVSAADYLDAASRDDAVLAAVARLSDAGAAAAVILGAAVVGVARRLQPNAAIPLFDGSAAVGVCLDRIATGASVPPRPSPVAGTVGLVPTLADLIAGTGDWEAQE